ncbi:MAG: PA14 domain-containing protein [Rhodospirillales bacterium]
MIAKPMRWLAGAWSTGLLLAVGSVAAQPPTTVIEPIRLASPIPAAPQPDAATLNDGLAVRYYFAKFNHVDELVDWMRFDRGVESPPLPHLDYESGPGNVLTTTSGDLVGAHITGFIGFHEVGTYRLRVTSNDGVRLTLAGEMVFEDPGVHGDATSPDLVFDITVPGWYPLDVLYFEKKGTATLRFTWQPPGADGFVPIPGSALKHP